MIYKPFQNISLSTLGMGNMRLPTLGDGPNAPIDKEKATAIIDYAMKNGINYFDTAYPYHGGQSEKFLGEALVGRYPRDSFYLASKYFVLAKADYKAMFQEQLERLQTDHIDFYLIHGIFDHTYQMYLDNGCIDYFLEQKRLGRIRYLGFSSHASVENLTTFADHHAWDFAQIQMNYYDWMTADTAKEYQVLADRNIPVIVMEPCRGGKLASLCPEADAVLKDAHPDWSIASWAFRWVKRHPAVQVVLSGMTTMEQIIDNTAVFSEADALSDADLKILDKACEIFEQTIKVPCTGCAYCTENCPMEIDVPGVMQAYNSYKLDGPKGLEGLNRLKSSTGPKDCIGCGACAARCPQSIAIPEIMAELTEAQKTMPPRP